MKRIQLFYCLGVLVALVAVGCSRTEPQPKPVAKPTAPVPTLPAGLLPGHPSIDKPGTLPAGHPKIDMSSQMIPADAVTDSTTPHWTVPAGWQPGKTSSVRRGSFAVTGDGGRSADIAITVFPGDVGGVASNVNRWRGQIGLDALTPEQATAAVTKLDVNGIACTVADFTATEKEPGKSDLQRLIVVTVPQAGNSWFFKMTGDASLLGAQKDALLQFVKSVKF